MRERRRERENLNSKDRRCGHFWNLNRRHAGVEKYRKFIFLHPYKW